MNKRSFVLMFKDSYKNLGQPGIVLFYAICLKWCKKINFNNLLTYRILFFTFLNTYIWLLKYYKCFGVTLTQLDVSSRRVLAKLVCPYLSCYNLDRNATSSRLSVDGHDWLCRVFIRCRHTRGCSRTSDHICILFLIVTRRLTNSAWRSDAAAFAPSERSTPTVSFQALKWDCLLPHDPTTCLLLNPYMEFDYGRDIYWR